MTLSVLLILFTAATTTALVPHKYWNRPVSRSSSNVRNNKHNNRLCMYFDDPERLDGDGLLSPESSSIYSSNWITSYQEEKRLALQNLLGYRPSSAAKLTDEQVEEETLRWAIDTNIVWVEDDMAEDNDNENINDDMSGSNKQQHQRRGKYDSIQDLKVASNCDTVLESLAFCWSVVADVLQERQEKDQQGGKRRTASDDSSSAHLIVFSRSISLWDYDVMVDMLLAIQISKPFLPAEYNLQLDLFHPEYKHSPRMFSPERHAPFPTLAISLQHKKKSTAKEMEMDIEATRAKLDKLFQSMDASRECVAGTQVDPENDEPNHGQILQDCMAWLSTKQQTMSNDLEWTVHTQQGGIGGPIQLYKTLWNTILTLPSSSPPTSSSMVVVPSLDSHTLHRVAVTVNAALIRLNIPVRITQVYTPFPTTTSIKGSFASPPPYGMIQLTPVSDGTQ